MKKLQITTKLAIISAAAFTLIASGGTTGTGTSGGGAAGGGTTPLALTGTLANVKINGTNQTVTNTKTPFTILQNGKDITVTRAGKTYKFTSPDEDNAYKLTSGNEKLELQNLSTNFLQSAKKYTTNDVNIWWSDLKDTTVNYHESGYTVVGTKTSSMPTSKIATYAGGLAGRLVTTADGETLTMAADASVAADFGTQKLTGAFTNFQFIDKNGNAKFQGSTLNIHITNGTITGNSLKGDLVSIGGNALTSSSLEGGFYGADAKEIGGTGQFADASAVATFGFTGKK